MNALSDSSHAAPAAETPPWTCPYCALLCDHTQVDLADPPRLRGASCPRADGALAHLLPADNPEATQAWVKGTRASVAEALDVAAQWLSQSRLPLFGGLATDVQGMRALYRLANVGGAILDHAHGEAMMPALRLGVGIARLPDFIVGDAIRSGELEEILLDWRPPPFGLHLVTPPSRLRPARVEALLDFLTRHHGC